MGEVFEFTVNGQVQRTEEDKPLLRYLRDDLKLYSVKDGCSEGACGTCTIVVDGKAIKSCVLTTKRAVGRNILTDFHQLIQSYQIPIIQILFTGFH